VIVGWLFMASAVLFVAAAFHFGRGHESRGVETTAIASEATVYPAVTVERRGLSERWVPKVEVRFFEVHELAGAPCGSFQEAQVEARRLAAATRRELIP